jgi:thymidine phosphorylase
LILCAVEKTIESAKLKVRSLLGSGAALEKFRMNIECQKGEAKICDNPEILLDKNLIRVEIKAEQSGYVSKINASAIGEGISRIGGGRIKVEDKIDFAVGYECAKTLGDKIKAGETMGVIYCRTDAQAATISEKIVKAYQITEEKPPPTKLIKEII